MRVVMRAYTHMWEIKMKLRFKNTECYLNHDGIPIEFTEAVAKWLCKDFPELEIIYPNDYQI